MKSRNGTTQDQIAQYDEVAEAMNLLKQELFSVTRKLNKLDDIEARKGTLSKGQETQYDRLVDKQLSIDGQLSNLSV
jgi:hypothetical protein